MSVLRGADEDAATALEDSGLCGGICKNCDSWRHNKCTSRGAQEERRALGLTARTRGRPPPLSSPAARAPTKALQRRGSRRMQGATGAAERLRTAQAAHRTPNDAFATAATVLCLQAPYHSIPLAY